MTISASCEADHRTLGGAARDGQGCGDRSAETVRIWTEPHTVIKKGGPKAAFFVSILLIPQLRGKDLNLDLWVMSRGFDCTLLSFQPF